jgi:transcriptional regulator with XRE-family HTH domain
MNYGKAFKVIRAITGLRQKELAQLLHIDPSYISLIERGTRKPSMTTLEALAAKISIPVHLITLLASEEADLKGATAEELNLVGESLAQLLLKGPQKTQEQ